MDLLDLYQRASDWTIERVAGASDQLGTTTPCEGWDVRTLLNHMLETQVFFRDSAQGKEAAPPSPVPPDVLSGEPAADFERARQEIVETFSEPGVIERTGPSLGIAFTDMLLHGWDIAVATGQDTTMPAGLPEAAYSMVHGRFTDEQRKGVFKPEVPVPDDAPAQDRLLGYTGRTPR
jgi:uncharacterized protein (TIGR03086 family)